MRPNLFFFSLKRHSQPCHQLSSDIRVCSVVQLRMRRFASVLVGTRDKQQPPTPTQDSFDSTSIPQSSSTVSLPADSPVKKKRSGFFSSRGKSTTALPTEPVPAILTTPALSVSSTSSEASSTTSIVTPEDDFERFAREAERDRSRGSGTWKAIIGARKSLSRKSQRLRNQPDLLAVDWRPKEQLPSSAIDGEPESEDDEGSATYSSSSSQIFHPPSRAPIPRSHTNLHALTLVTLNSAQSPHPLVHIPSNPVFPRSANSSCVLPHPPPSLQVQLLKTKILTRLESRSLTPAEELSIRPFGTRPKPTPPKRSPRSTDEEALQRIGSSAGSSLGLKRWALRPCFEERFVIWTEGAEGLEWSRVNGRLDFAVAELELSEWLIYLASLRRTLSRRGPPTKTPG